MAGTSDRPFETARADVAESLGNSRSVRDVTPGTAPSGGRWLSVTCGRASRPLFVGSDILRSIERPLLSTAACSLDAQKVPFDHFIEILNRGSRLSGQCDFGLRLAGRQSLDAVDSPLGIAIRSAPTIGEAIKFAAANMHTFSDAIRLEIDEEKIADELILTIHLAASPLTDARQVAEYCVGRVLCIVRSLCRQARLLKAVSLTHAPLGDSETYRQHLGLLPKFCSTRNRVVLVGGLSKAPVVDRDQGVFNIARRLIDDRQVKRNGQLRARVHRALFERIDTDADLTQAGISSVLGIHPRTFQRRLSAEGTSFKAIRDDVCRTLTLRYLRDSDLTLTGVAHVLGYSELSTFSRKCRDWFAHPPGKLRELLRARFESFSESDSELL